MLTRALAGRVATDWAGDPGAILDYAVRFTRPVVVPDDDDGTDLVVAGRVESVDSNARTATVVLTATVADAGVLSGARAVLQLT
jgi:acyl dehydratase